MKTNQNLSNGMSDFKKVKNWKKLYLTRIWETVTPTNAFGTLRRIDRISSGAKPKPSEQIILNQIK